MRNRSSWFRASCLSVALASFGLAGCDVDVEDPGKLPEVDIEEGEMPEVDVTGPEIDVEKETTEIPVPDVDIDIPQENEQ